MRERCASRRAHSSLQRALEKLKVPVRQKLFDFDAAQMKIYEQTGETETFRWIEWKDFSDETVTLPIDKLVAKKVKGLTTDHSP